ncbi:AMP-binding protein [Sulfidibacter corallicola]|uniref:AMP-binding protein n=1 Tax=Sulfidibacter corallicola TaxID=2818388 RepID=A0A8A4TV83_SULCO|nr:AMP-binding protein [Sulfidibacter corallicola]QTD52922.1 AMP-binding protein [Sulfidibacter corallicola]
MTSLSSVSTFLDLLRWRAQEKPDHATYLYLEDGEHREVPLTNHELDIKARAIAAKLQSLVKSGDRALLLFPAGLSYLTAFYGCMYAGVVAVPAYPPNRASLQKNLPRLMSIIEDAQASVVLCNTDIHGMAASLFENQYGGGPHFIPTDQLSDEWAYDWTEPHVKADDIAFLQYTSGSTGQPKGVILNHHNILDNSERISRRFGIHANSVVVSWLPPYHDMGLIGGLLQPLYSGIRVILMSPFSFLRKPMRWLRTISQYGATCSGGPNFAYELCLQKATEKDLAMLDLSSWESAFNGAEPISSQTLDRFADAFSICGFQRDALYPVYGMAEATLMVTGGDPEDSHAAVPFDEEKLEEHRAIRCDRVNGHRTLVGCGHALEEHVLEVVDPQSEAPCPNGNIGEIWVSGPSIAQGYFNQEALTERVFGAELGAYPGRKFLRTGDLGFLFEDQLYVTGRLKDLIIIRGRNYYPHDLERTVEYCHPAIRPGCAAAFSIEVDREEQLVLVQEIQRKCDPAELPRVIEHIRRTISEQFEVRTYAIALIRQGTIPKTSSGKIRRSFTRHLFLEDKLEVIGKDVLQSDEVSHGYAECEELAAKLRDELDPIVRRAQLIRIVTEILRAQPGLGKAKITPHTSLSTLGIDSVMATEMANQIENFLNVDLQVVMLLEGPKVADIAEEIQNLKWPPDGGMMNAHQDAPDRYASLFARKERGTRRRLRQRALS